MLSQATTWSDFAILCPFHDDIFLENKPNEELQGYHQYLQSQDRSTKTILKEECSFINSLAQVT